MHFKHGARQRSQINITKIHLTHRQQQHEHTSKCAINKNTEKRIKNFTDGVVDDDDENGDNNNYKDDASAE